MNVYSESSILSYLHAHFLFDYCGEKLMFSLFFLSDLFKNGGRCTFKMQNLQQKVWKTWISYKTWKISLIWKEIWLQLLQSKIQIQKFSWETWTYAHRWKTFCLPILSQDIFTKIQCQISWKVAQFLVYLFSKLQSCKKYRHLYYTALPWHIWPYWESVAGSVIQATGTVEFEDGLRTGVLPWGCWYPWAAAPMMKIVINVQAIFQFLA